MREGEFNLSDEKVKELHDKIESEVSKMPDEFKSLWDQYKTTDMGWELFQTTYRKLLESYNA